jgi:hypothetical protein
MSNSTTNESTSDEIRAVQMKIELAEGSSGSNLNEAIKTQLQASTTSTAIPLPTRMVLAEVAGMVADMFCHPLDVVHV